MHREALRVRDKPGIVKKNQVIVIVCPSLGGHIEHTANLANSFAEMARAKVYILSREGARSQTRGLLKPDVEVVEKVPPLTNKSSPTSVRMFQKAFRLFKEIAQVSIFCKSVNATLVILQEPRYGPLVNLFHAKVALFLHNIPNVKLSEAKQTFEAKLSLSTAKYSDFVIVHGKLQRITLSRLLPLKNIIQVPLPGMDTWFAKNATRPARSNDGIFLCLGEIRKTKSLELLVEASAKAELPVKIVGRKTDLEYFVKLVSLAEGSDFCDVEEKFLSAADFDREVAKAHCLILPYSDFQAQSHVLAKAMAFGTPAIVSDLPSLRDQANNCNCVSFFEMGNADSLARAMKQFNSSVRLCSPFSHQWSQVAFEILRGTSRTT